MSKQHYNSNQLYGFLPDNLEGVDSLAELALNVRWCWNHAADNLWKELDPALWELTHNPWIVLQTVSRDTLERQLASPAFQNKIAELLKSKELAIASPAWFELNHPDSPLSCVAYFSMEFMLSEALPIYVGGLGNVAGDQLKSASDLGVPVVAVGLLYQQGYFRQEIDKYGQQKALFPYNDPGQLPITPLRLPNGEWLRLTVSLPGYPVWLRTWQVQVGRVTLYLLDSNDAANLPVHRTITSELYGGGEELRIKQEIVLGIGGYKLLRALGIEPEVCHMNEGHAAFLVLERANDFMKKTGVSFEEALFVTRAGNLFTTHTAVAAGFDHFSIEMVDQYLGTYASKELGISLNDLMALGRQNAGDHSERFNMAYLAIHGSGAVNGVSVLHGEVSRKLFQNLFPRWPTNEVPIGAVTNGVHMPTWDSENSDGLWTAACGKDRWRGNLETLEQQMLTLSDETLWLFRCSCRKDVVSYVRKRFETQLKVAGEADELVETAKHIFNVNTLTLGFARRFVSYKRPDLLLHDPARFIRILTNTERPVQLIISGKAPPFDESGKTLITKWVQFIREHNLYHHIVFLSDYDMLLAGNIVQGVDVWLNTPRRPWEACGTSGMKVLVNGGINLSELDGWWAEAYTPEVGWALGDGLVHGDDSSVDASEANSLYEILEQQVIPEFYNLNKNGIPAGWTGKMRKSMSALTPQFSANRCVRQYTEHYYLPAAAKYKMRSDRNNNSNSITRLQHHLKDNWKNIRFGEVSVDQIENEYLFRVSLFLNDISTTDVLVQLYAEGTNGDTPLKINMETNNAATSGQYLYQAKFSSMRPASEYTARVIPASDNISIPLECALILWEH